MIRNGELVETRGDKMPIGINAVVERSFTNHDIKLEMGDLIYIFSDGYPDQFGGPEEKKFRYKNFQKLLVQNRNKPLESQKRELERNFIQWKGNLEQVDDVLVIGIKI
jgi:serine phosphatase RsbU (regulator of sigma subunit)